MYRTPDLLKNKFYLNQLILFEQQEILNFPVLYEGKTHSF